MRRRIDAPWRGRRDAGESPRPSGASGFTLVEILVALLVVIFAIIPLLNLNAISRRRGQQGEAYAMAQIEADRLVNHYAGQLGYEELAARLGDGDEVEFSEAEPDIAELLAQNTGLEQSAREVRRKVVLRRLEPGLFQVQALVTWQSTAPVQDLDLTVHRFVHNPWGSVRVHPPFVTAVSAQGCN